MSSNYQYIYVVLSLCVILAVRTVEAQPLRTPWWNYPGAQCLKPNQTQNFSNLPMPPLPQMPKQFQTRVEANIRNKHYTITAEEYFDGPGNRASLWLLSNNSQNALIYDYANNQILYVVNGSCKASNLSLDTNSLLFGGLSGNGVPHVYSTSGALEFAKRNGLAYIGQTTVRGVDVDHWQSCMTWDILFANFTLDYYFTVPNWTDPVSQPQIPVRAIIKGRNFNFNDGTWHDFEHYYDYFDFRNKLWADDNVFKSPKGMVCSNLKQTRPKTPWNYPGAQCLKPNQTQNFSNLPMPPLPQMPKQFQTRVEANIRDKQYTITAEEYFDGPGNRASLWLLSNNSQNALIYDYANNQILYVVNGACNASILSLDTNSLLFGGLSGNGVPHVYSTSGALEFAKRNGLAYMGQTTVRDVDVDHWQSCMTWDILFANFTLDYYFTVPNWTDPVSQPQIPVRAIIKGRNNNFNDGTWHDFEHYYDYFDFRNQLWADDNVFKTPKGMVCSNRKQTRPVPQLMGQYSYREEIISKGSKQESQADVWYDYAYQLVRFDYRPSASVYPFWSTDAASEIHDYVTGIAYAIDRTIGNCTIMPIENATFTASLNKTQTTDGRPEFFLKMKNASQLFYLDNTTYTYEGQRKCRDMNCDVFISNRNDFHLDGYGTFNSTFEYYFLANDWTAVNNVGYSTQQSTSVPIRLDITSESWVGYAASYNIYNFDQEHPALSSFDITTCFNPDQRMDFRIDFPDTYDDGTYKYKKVFMEKIILLITQLTKISPIRVQKTSFTMLPDNSFFIGTLLEVPPPTVFYRRIPGVYMQFANDKAITTDDEYGCASQCNQNTDFICNSFDYCPGTKTCTLSKTHTEDGKLTDSSGQCDHFARTVNNPSLLITLAQAWQILRDIVIHGSFKIPMTLDAGAQKTYTASAITNDVLRSDTRQTSSTSLLSQFRAQINKAIPGYDDLILTGMAIDDCAAACYNQEEWVCNSFEFHFDSGWCVLSKLHPDEMPNIIQNQQFVDLYIRKYTAAFNQIAGTTVLSSSDAIYQNIFSPDECAKLCVDYDGFNCKSFDYCDDISTCFLGKTHYYDVPKANIQADPMCSHYSLKYLYDFKKYTRKVIQNLDDRIIAGVSVDQCAKLCVDEETFSCASFDYCGNVTECRLSTAAMKGVGQVTLEQQDWCDVYTRQTFPDGTPYVANAQKYYNLPKQDTSKKYTAGAMSGLAFAMLIIGVLLSGGILYGYTRYKAKAGDDMTIHFSKKEETES